MRLWCVAQWRRVDACVTDGHCSAPVAVNDCSVALCHNGRVFCGPGNDFGSIFDAVSGAMLRHSRCDFLRVDTSGAMLWREWDNTIVVSSGLNSARRVLVNVVGQPFASFRYGVAVNWTKNRVLRFDIDPEPTAEPDRKASVAACATL